MAGPKCVKIVIVRDIREDLRDRLNAIQEDQDRHRLKISELEAQKKILTTLLEEENRLWGAAADTVKKQFDLCDAITDIMSDGGEWFGGTVTEVLLKRGFQFGSSKAGRVVHFTLLGMARRDLVESVGDGRWKLKPPRDVVNHAA